MIRRMNFAEVRETPRKHENSKKALILGVPEFLQYEICESPLKYYTLKRAFPAGELTEEAAAGAHAAIVKQVCS